MIIGKEPSDVLISLSADDLSEMELLLKDYKKIGIYSLVLSKFWIYPQLWDQLGVAKHLIYEEGIKNRVILTALESNIEHYNRCIKYAGITGDLQLVDYFWDKVDPDDRSLAFSGAIVGKQLDLILVLRRRGLSVKSAEMDIGEANDPHLSLILSSMVSVTESANESIICGFARGGHMFNLIQLDHIHEFDEPVLRQILFYGLHGEKTDVVIFALDKLIKLNTNGSFNPTRFVPMAAEVGNKLMIDLLISKGKCIEPLARELAASMASVNGFTDIASYMQSL
jgi:hypothetical protein